MKTTLLLVRHGESVANKEAFFAGQKDISLVENGILQAKLSAEYVKKHYQVDAIYTSDLIRAYETAEIFSKVLHLEINTDKGLREIHAGEWEGKKHEELPKLYPESYGTVWLRHIGKAVAPGGESVKELGTRVIQSLENVAKKHPGQTILIATHATPIRASQSIIQYGSVDNMETVPWVSNASVTEITYEEGKWDLIQASIDEHLSKFKTIFSKNV